MTIDLSRETDGVYLPKQVSSEIWGLTREGSAVMAASRNINIPGSGIAIPVVVGNAVAQWVGETQPKPVSNHELDTRIMRPYKLAVIEVFSDEFRRDLPGLYRELARQLPQALANKIDATVAGALAVPGSDFNTLADAPVVDLNGANGIDGLLNVATSVSAAGGRVSHYLATPGLRSDLLRAAVTNKWGNPFEQGDSVGHVLGAQVLDLDAASVTAPFTGVAGDFAGSAIIGTVGGIRISRSTEATVGGINLFEQGMFAIRAEIEVGFIVRDINRFARISSGPAGFAAPLAAVEVADEAAGPSEVADEAAGPFTKAAAKSKDLDDGCDNHSR